MSDKISLQLIAGGECSTLTQEGAGGKQRSFFRPKGSLSLSARISQTFSADLKVIRRVGQLDFGEFLARVFLDGENENAGNPDLVPQQQWRAELELAKDLGAYGKVRVRATAGNLLNARSRWDRVVYAGRRNSAPIDFVETRNRLIGPIFSFSVRGTL